MVAAHLGRFGGTYSTRIDALDADQGCSDLLGRQISIKTTMGGTMCQANGSFSADIADYSELAGGACSKGVAICGRNDHLRGAKREMTTPVSLRLQNSII